MKATKVKTKRLYIKVMTEAEVVNLILTTMDNNLSNACSKRYRVAVNNRIEYNWYAPWRIYLKKDNTPIGFFCFKGPCKNDAVEIGYGIEEEHQKKGYATESVSAMIDWAFYNSNAYFVEAETTPENSASRHVLEKLGFTEDSYGKEGPRFSVMRKMYPVVSTIMFLFFSIGLSAGIFFDKIILGTTVGLLVGFAAGSIINIIEKNKVDEIKEKRKRRLSE